MALRTSKTDLLIIGAGPAGLMAACWASQFVGMSTRIIDQKAERTATGHADGIHSRTLEIFDSFGIVDPVMRRGVHEVEMSYWGVNPKSKELECEQRVRSQPADLSRFGQVLLNQGEVEQVMIDYIEEKGRVAIERNKSAEKIYFTDHPTHPVAVETKSVRTDRMVNVLQDGTSGEHGHAEVTEVIQAQYVVACDGARSLAREQLDVPLETKSTDSTWAVIDIVPITDFPDIRQSCAIHSDKHGSIMTAPRENRLVRFYLQLTGDSDLERKAQEQTEESPDAIVQLVQMIMEPYTLTYEYCDWWSIYPIKQALVTKYQINNRVFLAGDAAHTHSPKAGQGMNVSIQDTYNLVWKIGSVVTGVAEPHILETYEGERHPVAEQLMKMDAKLVKAYEQKGASISQISRIRDGHAGFMSGVEVTYLPSPLIASQHSEPCAKGITVGMRLKSVPVMNHADGSIVQLTSVLSSNGAWRLLVFAGDLGQSKQVARLRAFSQRFDKQPLLSSSKRTIPLNEWHMVLEVILIHAGARTSVKFIDLPELFRPFDEKLGWDYEKIFADDQSYGHASACAYHEYGIREGEGCIILVRPDQHVAMVADIEDVESLESYISQWHTARHIDN
ncbi:FAD binding domain-containing protein [Aspergillus pseudoustus]|uniref:FAD binding domain-containing protein n=1 Tax=Aspergillus pseudoustus TaxID=1810923 RepID=A0ABR4JR94_9EURO